MNAEWDDENRERGLRAIRVARRALGSVCSLCGATRNTVVVDGRRICRNECLQEGTKP